MYSHADDRSRSKVAKPYTLNSNNVTFLLRFCVSAKRARATSRAVSVTSW